MSAFTTPPRLGNVRQLPAMDAHELLRRSCKFDLTFTLDQLRILKAIAAEGSFRRAVDRLYVSQPALTLQVQNLERQLNIPLFELGVFHKAHVENVVIKQVVSVIFSPNRYRSKAKEIFRQEVLPRFATLETAKALLNSQMVGLPI